MVPPVCAPFTSDSISSKQVASNRVWETDLYRLKNEDFAVITCLPGFFRPPPPPLRLFLCNLLPRDRPRPRPSPGRRAPTRPRRTWDGRRPPRCRTRQNRPRFRNRRTMFVAQLESEEGELQLNDQNISVLHAHLVKCPRHVCATPPPVELLPYEGVA